MPGGHLTTPSKGPSCTWCFLFSDRTKSYKVEASYELPPLKIEHGRNTYCKEMGLNLWNITFETNYKIRLEHKNEDMSFTCKSFVSKLPHHQSIVANSCFSGFHPLA